MKLARAFSLLLALPAVLLPACSPEDKTLDSLTLAATEVFEDFESNWSHDDLSWQRDHTYPCYDPDLSTGESHSTSHSARMSCDWWDDAYGDSSIWVTLDRSAGDVQFWYRTSSESYDKLYFYIDGDEKDAWGGSNGWTLSPTYQVTAGSHTYKWEYERDWTTSSGSDAVWVDDITFPPGSHGAEFVSQANVPTSMTPSQTAQVQVTMKNTGSTTWTQATNFKLGSQNPQDNSNWGFNRMQLGGGDSITQGQNKTFDFQITAPATPGTYGFQWQMLQESVKWFGEFSDNIDIVVDTQKDLTSVTASHPSTGRTRQGYIADYEMLQLALDVNHSGGSLPLDSLTATFRGSDAADVGTVRLYHSIYPTKTGSTYLAFDDGARAFVNGKLVNENLNEDHGESYWNATNADIAWTLKHGANLFAAVVHNGALGGGGTGGFDVGVEMNGWWVIPPGDDDSNMDTLDADCNANPSFKYWAGDGSRVAPPLDGNGYAWWEPQYDDSTWSDGHTPFGGKSGCCTTGVLDTDSGDWLYVRKWFMVDDMLGQETLSGGEVTFSGLAHDLPEGASYLWVNADTMPDSGESRTLDLYIAQSSDLVVTGDSSFSFSGDPAGNRPIACELFHAPLEASNGSFTHDGDEDEWEWGSPTADPKSDISGGGKGWDIDLNSSYSSYACNYLRSPVIDLSGATNARLRFWHWQDFETNYDGGNIQVYNGSSWGDITPSTGYDDSSISASGCSAVNGKPGFEDDHGWREVWVDLSAYSNSDFQFQLNFGSDSSNTDDGWSVDEFVITSESCGLPDGSPCNSDPECGSGHCDNNICCAAGDCCTGVGHCGVAACASCQSYMCVYEAAGTDCGTCVNCNASGDCNVYDATQDGDCPSCEVCSAIDTCASVAAGQDPKGDCPTATCRTGECDGASACQLSPEGTDCGTCAECNLSGSCVFDSSQNDDCGLCRKCGAVGSCVVQTASEDIKGECTAASCQSAGYYYGWVGDTCYFDGGSYGELCDGAGACRTASADCTAASQGPAAETRTTCRTTGGCTGSAGPSQGFVIAGQDTYDDCDPDLQSTCNQDGDCDGAGGCRLWIAGTECVAPSCSADTEHYADTCDGAGVCQDGGSAECPDQTCVPGSGSTPSHVELDDTCGASACGDGGTQTCTGYVTCDGIDCPTTCAGDGDCVTGYSCDGSNHCVPGSGLGSPCSIPGDCASGHCVDDVCCNSACGGLCQRCDLTGSEGACSPSNAGTDPDNECNGACLTGDCNGSGACALESQGTDCGICAECDAVGTCIYDDSQDGDCPLCEECSGLGACTAQADGDDIKGECTPASCQSAGYYHGWVGDTCYYDGATYGGVCNGASACRTAAQECSGTVQGAAAESRGVCRSTADCVGTTPPSQSPVSGGTDPYGDCDTEAQSTCGRDGDCDGSGACRLWASGTVCQAATCTDDFEHAADTCDGAGTCQDGGSAECSDQTCVPGSGDTPSHLELDDICGATACQDGGSADCDGYVTCAGTDCPSACAGDADCVTSYHCDGSNLCVPDQGNGNPCGRPGECASGFCVDGVCCNNLCDGLCRRCDLAGSVGTCDDVATGDNPDDDCKVELCRPGYCDGSGGCAISSQGTDCGICGECDTGGTCVYDDSQDEDCGPCLECGNLDTCVPQADGQDVKNDCTPVDCASAGYYHGWIGDACHFDGGSYGDLCNGEGNCRGPADDCDGTPQGAVALIRTACRTPEGCTGSTIPTLGLVDAADDPYDDCTAEPASTCGLDGNCDGAGACRLHPVGTVCLAAHCTADEEHFDDTCDGLGVCQDGGSTECPDAVCIPGSGSTPSYVELDDTCLGVACDDGGILTCTGYITCSGDSCPATCSGDGDCVSGYHCDGVNHCVPDADLGTPCTLPGDCSSNFCIDGVCCNSICNGLCQRCDLSGAEGTCSPIPGGQDPDSECEAEACRPGHCDGIGQCSVRAPGTDCGICAACDATGNCLYDGSQNGDCGLCRKCADVDSCVPQGDGEDLKAECTPGSCTTAGYYFGWVGDTCYSDGGSYGDVCDGAGACRTASNDCRGAIQGGAVLDRTPCSTPGGCSGHEAPSLGDVAAGTDPYDDCAQEDASTCGRDGECNGAGTCRLWTSGTVCDPAHCDAEVEHADDTCDGAGSCDDGGSTACATAICVPGADSTPSYVDRADACGDTQCEDGGIQVCTGYITCSGDSCPNTCVGNADCVSGYRCDPTNHCVPQADLGTPCTTPDDCSTNFCVDGVCCNSACDGLCQRCDNQGTEGACSPVLANEDPDEECGEDGCHPGFCDGTGQCANRSQGTDCGLCAVCNDAGECNVFDATQGDECGLCRKCQAVDSCTPQANGQDERDECAGVSCASAGYYFGWGTGAERDTCYYDAALYGETCDGAGACRAATQDCQGLLKGDAAATRPLCRERAGCLGDTPPSFPRANSGSDPYGDCDAADPSTCQQDGSCDGLGACRLYAEGTECAAATCSDADTAQDASYCDGAGVCTAGEQHECPDAQCLPGTGATPSRVEYDDICQTDSCVDGGIGECSGYVICDGDDCPAACSDDSDCVAGYHCDGTCKPDQGLGQPCTTEADCGGSMFCVDNVCCNSACDTACVACNIADHLGTCTAVPQGQDPRGDCDGQGCIEGFCNGGGACAVRPADTDCGICAVCDAEGNCSVYDALQDEDCPECQECSDLFTCIAVAELTDPKDDCAASEPDTCGLTGFCGAAGACDYWKQGLECQAATCVGSTLMHAWTCDGAGACVDGGSEDCAHGCQDGACLPEPESTEVEADADAADADAGEGADADEGTPEPEAEADAAEGELECVVTSTDPPEARPAVAPTEGPAALQVSLDGSQSQPGGARITGYRWTPGDGSRPLEGVTVEHVYLLPGAYEVVLEVEDCAGGRDASEPQTVTVTDASGNRAPVVTIEAAAPQGLTATLTMTVTDPDGDEIVARLWDFGDGTGAVDTGEPTDHTFDAAGTYLIRAAATDAAGLTGRDERALTVGEITDPITVRVFADQVAGQAPHSVHLEAEIEGTWEQLFWDFDDGTTAGPGRETTQWHTYDGAGVYQVRARATAGANLGVGGVTITVLGPEGGLPPKIVSIPGLVALPGVPYHYDEDDKVDVAGRQDNLSFGLGKEVDGRKVNRPSGMSVDGQGKISWTPSRNQAGLDHKVSLVVTNDHGADFQDWTITVQGKRVTDDCGCGAAGAGSGAGAGVLLVLLAALRRRRE